jgi:hypothetical protein
MYTHIYIHIAHIPTIGTSDLLVVSMFQRESLFPQVSWKWIVVICPSEDVVPGYNRGLLGWHPYMNH